jgi:acetylornithine deacetylase/succinyl-diaminopimelate desuccinylase-like protein
MLAALHDDRGRVTIPGFYDKVRQVSKEEGEEIKRIPFDRERLLQEMGVRAIWSGEVGYTPLERIGARPTLELHGIRGGFVGEGQKTVIPARVLAKVSMRLVPDQDPLEVARLFEERIHELAPPTVKVQVRTLSHANAAVIERDTPAMQSAVMAFRQGFGADPVFLRSGGTLPVVPMLVRTLNVPVIMMGLGQPGDNAHAPNEHFSLSHFYRGIDTSIYFMQEMASRE